MKLKDGTALTDTVSACKGPMGDLYEPEIPVVRLRGACGCMRAQCDR